MLKIIYERVSQKTFSLYITLDRHLYESVISDINVISYLSYSNVILLVFQIFFKIPDFTHTGCYIDPKSIQISNNVKYKLVNGR